VEACPIFLVIQVLPVLPVVESSTQNIESKDKKRIPDEQCKFKFILIFIIFFGCIGDKLRYNARAVPNRP
jgi:hypothetical protein